MIRKITPKTVKDFKPALQITLFLLLFSISKCQKYDWEDKIFIPNAEVQIVYEFFLKSLSSLIAFNNEKGFYFHYWNNFKMKFSQILRFLLWIYLQ